VGRQLHTAESKDIISRLTNFWEEVPLVNLGQPPFSCDDPSMANHNSIRAALDQAREEMIFIGPDHPYYALLADLVGAIEEAWQQGYEHHRGGGTDDNPYSWRAGGH
jgi:hypothetical protein